MAAHSLHSPSGGRHFIFLFQLSINDASVETSEGYQVRALKQYRQFGTCYSCFELPIRQTRVHPRRGVDIYQIFESSKTDIDLFNIG